MRYNCPHHGRFCKGRLCCCKDKHNWHWLRRNACIWRGRARRLGSIPFLLAVALLIVAVTEAAHADVIPAGGVRLTATSYWKTCVPRAWAARPGGWMIYNDQFRGASGRACISSTGLNLTVLTNAQPGLQGGVTDSPMISYGEYFGYRDAQSGLPLPVSFIEHTVWTRRFSCTGHATGSWICDAFDAFFSPSFASGSQHGYRELVVQTRTATGGTGYGSLTRISGHLWRAIDWTTCPASTAPLCWPIMRFSEVHQTGATQKLRLPAFLRWCVAHGWLPRSAWLDNVPARPEIWSGGKGLHISIGKGDIIRLPPVIRQLKAAS